VYQPVTNSASGRVHDASHRKNSRHHRGQQWLRAAPGKRPTRTVVGITWGVDEMNAFTQPRQDALLKEMQLDTVLGGADA
jgi:hypothetical protein